MIVFFDPVVRAALIVGLMAGFFGGTLWGRWSAFFQLRTARVWWHEVRRWRRLRRLRRS